MERDNHLMDRGWRNPKIPLHIGLRRRATVDLRVEVDERQVLTLLLGEPHVRTELYGFLGVQKPRKFRVCKLLC